MPMEERDPFGRGVCRFVGDPRYSPPQTTELLPATGGAVAAVVVVKAKLPILSSPPKMLHFSGYDWLVRDLLSYRGGSMISFDPANAWTDANGALHLRVTKNQDGWGCAEVRLTRSLGYGTYLFVVRDISHLEPSAVLTTLRGIAWSARTKIARNWILKQAGGGSRTTENAQYVVQPYYIPNEYRSV